MFISENLNQKENKESLEKICGVEFEPPKKYAQYLAIQMKLILSEENIAATKDSFDDKHEPSHLELTEHYINSGLSQAFQDKYLPGVQDKN